MVAETGNTIPSPPRLNGSWDEDYGAIVEWMNQLFQAIAVEANLTGTQAELSDRVAALEAENTSLKERVVALEDAVSGIAGLDYMTGTVSASYVPAELAAAWNKINDIIAQARGV